MYLISRKKTFLNYIWRQHENEWFIWLQDIPLVQNYLLIDSLT